MTMYQEILDWKNKFEIGFYETKERLTKNRLAIENIDTLLFVGMGGSGIIGNIFELILNQKKRSLRTINSNSNRIPNNLPSNSIALVSSYSGNTWETIAACTELLNQNIPLMIITHGGLLANIAKKEDIPLFLIKECSAPRASLGSFLGITFALLEALKLIEKNEFPLEELLNCIAAGITRYKKQELFSFFLATQKKESQLHIVAVTGDADAAAYRAQTQCNENSKIPAIFQPYPELCHNLIVGITGSLQAQSVLFMHTEFLLSEEKKGITALKMLLDEYKIPWYHVSVHGKTWLEQLVDLIIWADFASFYLAKQKNIEITAVKAIDQLKEYFTTLQ